MTKELFIAHIDPITAKLQRFAFGILKDPEETRDALQEVFVKLWKMRTQLNEYRSIEALAMRITRNHCLDRLKAIQPIGLDHMPIQTATANPQTVLEGSDAIQQVKFILKTLPELQRRVVELRDFEGYEYEEIAEILETNVNAVRVTLSRARKKLREGLTKVYTYEHQ